MIKYVVRKTIIIQRFFQKYFVKFEVIIVLHEKVTSVLYITILIILQII